MRIQNEVSRPSKKLGKVGIARVAGLLKWSKTSSRAKQKVARLYDLLKFQRTCSRSVCCQTYEAVSSMTFIIRGSTIELWMFKRSGMVAQNSTFTRTRVNSLNFMFGYMRMSDKRELGVKHTHIKNGQNGQIDFVGERKAGWEEKERLLSRRQADQRSQQVFLCGGSHLLPHDSKWSRVRCRVRMSIRQEAGQGRAGESWQKKGKHCCELW